MRNGLSGRGQNRMTWNGNINPYTINAVQFDAGEKISAPSGFSATGSKFALYALSFYYPTTWPASGTMTQMLDSGFNYRFQIAFASSGRIIIDMKNSAGTSIATFVPNTGEFAADTWYTLAVSLDTTAGSKRWQVYKRVSGGSWTACSIGSSSITDDGIIADCVYYDVNNDANLCYFADVWGSIGQTIDLSNPANLDKFLPSADKGAAGATPTGTSPQVFFSGATASWHVNKGTGGGSSLTGTLSTAPSFPV